MSQFSQIESHSYNQSAETRNIPTKNFKRIRLGQIGESGKMVTLPRIDNHNESLEPASVYYTQATTTTEEKEVRTSTLNLSLLPTDVLPTKTASSKRSQLNLDDASIHSQVLKKQSFHDISDRALKHLLDDDSEHKVSRDIRHYKKTSNSVYRIARDANSAEDQKLAAKVNRSFQRSIKEISVTDSIDQSSDAKEYQYRTASQPITHSEVSLQNFAKNSPVFMD